MKKLIAVALTCVIVLAVASAVGLKATEVNAAQTTNTRVPASPTKDAAGQAVSTRVPRSTTQTTAPGLSSSARWQRSIVGSGDDMAYAVQQTSDGGYIIAGYTKPSDSYDAWLIKTDAYGNERWNKTFGGSGDDYAYGVQQTSDGGYILAGYTNSHYDYLDDAWLIKTDANGNKAWNRTFTAGYDDFLYAVQQTRDGGYVLAGKTYSLVGGSNDAWLIKTDVSGYEQWNKTFGGSGDDAAYAVQQTRDGGYVLAGSTSSFDGSSTNAYLVKTNASGDKVWDKIYSGGTYQWVMAVQQTRDGGYILAGHVYSYYDGLADAWLIKTDAYGNKLWDNHYRVSGYAEATAVQQTRDGGYVLAGQNGYYGAYYVYLVKTDSRGLSS